jgi:hypothetical protein
VARRQFAAIPGDKKAPVIWGLIKLDGADTALLHYLDDVKPEDVTIGMRVKAVFSDVRKGAIRDISHFKPVKYRRSQRYGQSSNHRRRHDKN